MSDLIALTGLRVRGHHGVFPEERRDGQEFIVGSHMRARDILARVEGL